MCLYVGTPKTIDFPFVSNGKLMVFSVPIIKRKLRPNNIFFQIYHIYNPRAVQIGDENVVQDGSEKNQEGDSGAESDLETKETAHKKKSAIDKSTKKEETVEKEEKSSGDKNINKKVKEIEPEEEMDRSVFSRI